MPDLKDFLIIDDNAIDVSHLRACLHMVAGYEVSVREAGTTQGALDAVKERHPQVVFTDSLNVVDTAYATILKLRGIGYLGPVVVVTGNEDPVRRQQAMAAGAVEVVGKDNLTSQVLARTLAKVREAIRPASTRH